MHSEANEKSDWSNNGPKDVVDFVLLQLLNEESKDAVEDLESLAFKIFQVKRNFNKEAV